MIRATTIAIAVVLGSLVLGLASTASAGTASLAFTHSAASNIVEYRALLGYSSGNYTEEHSLGVPPAIGHVFAASLQIPDDVPVYIAVVAVDSSGVRSAPSNERMRLTESAGLLGAPGRPVIVFP